MSSLGFSLPIIYLLVSSLCFLSGGLWMSLPGLFLLIGSVIFDATLPFDKASHDKGSKTLLNILLYSTLPGVYLAIVCFNIEMAKSSLALIPEQYRSLLEALAGNNLKTARHFADEIPKSFLTDTFKSEKLPACNKETAAVLQRAFEHKPYTAWEGMLNVAKKLTTLGPPSAVPAKSAPSAR
ncbi:MAG: hypothetical protein EOP04_14405 [Proteobacteria bacterium]|nr:MAG: hypothetical protein EOP04_14405 [Pseudomonadota bacterium]